MNKILVSSDFLDLTELAFHTTSLMLWIRMNSKNRQQQHHEPPWFLRGEHYSFGAEELMHIQFDIAF